MPGDYTRDTFNPFRDYLAVLMQQGRVLVDADFNNLNRIIDRHFRSETIDTIGRCVVPRETPEGFQIQLTGTSFTIGRGRLYAHGLQAENHGEVPLEFDHVLAEQRGTLPVPYEEQPYFPTAGTVSRPREGGPHLVYADVWQREVTHVEDPDLVDKAVGVDTAARLQTVWQVKVLANVGNVTCATPDAEIPGWLDIIRPSAGRLSTSAVGVPADTDPCVVPASGGFRGAENRLYRIEVHTAGPLAGAAVKWSRDNASIATAVTAINAGRDVLTVSRTGRDSILRFSPGDWIEVTDDFRELAGQAGEMRKVLLVDDVSQTVTLTAALTAGVFDAANPVSRHTRIRCWDQKGQVLDALNNVVADVDASNGVIPIPAGGTFVLEDGVQVTLSTDPAGGSFRVGDYWIFAARTVDASVEVLTAAPPKGIHHHYCRLALITFPSSVVDCRTLWPPRFEQGCDCTECVSAESHNSGAFTIQMAVDRAKATGGKVCLGPGVFLLGNTPVTVQGAQSLRIEGKGWRTLLLYTGAGAAIRVASSVGFEIADLFIYAFSLEGANAALTLQNSVLVRVERCMLFQARRDPGGADVCLGIGGLLLEASIRDNILSGNAGIASLATGLGDRQQLAQSRTLTLTLNLDIENNLVVAQRRGISLDGLTIHLGDARVARNSVYGGSDGAIVARGLVALQYMSSSRIDIEGNALAITGDGIVVGSDNARVDGNDIGVIPSAANRQAQGGNGIVLDRSLFRFMGSCRVTGNRIMGVGGNGVLIRASIGSAMIGDNLIDVVGGSGIAMEERGSADNLSIENNQLLRIAATNNDPQTPLAAIRVARCRQVEISSNSIDRFAPAAVQNPARYGIEVFACQSVRIAGNDLTNLGPPADFVKAAAGIFVQAPFDRLDVVDNSVRRSSTVGTPADNSSWIAVLIASAAPGPTGAPTRATTTLFPFLTHIGGEFFAVSANAIAVFQLGKEIAAIRGNLLESYGIANTVNAAVAGAAVFSDNRCILAQRATATAGGVPVVDLSAGAAVASANFIQRTPANDSIEAIRLTVGNGPFTMLGNIAMGCIYRVNGGPLPAPWAPLNVIKF